MQSSLAVSSDLEDDSSIRWLAQGWLPSAAREQELYSDGPTAPFAGSQCNLQPERRLVSKLCVPQAALFSIT